MGNDDDDSFSSDSDDEFLTMNHDGVGGDGGGAGAGNVDREALIRKKLLENFYGKSAVGHGGDNVHSKVARDSNRDPDDTDDDESDYDDDGRDKKPSAGGQSGTSYNDDVSNDLDSKNFDAAAHTVKHVVNDSVHTLLETQEQLACQVRTLDSSMQTLVYENYSRFIDATDAIKSIGTTVEAHQDGLSKLSSSMQVIHETSHEIESSLGTIRDAVVEKIRIKRLLTRLDTLLKLPKTLRDQIKVGKYRLAAKSYLSAANILRKHSSGFESLKTIEADCHNILSKLLIDLKRKLIHWSGGNSSSVGNENVDNSEHANEGSSSHDDDPPDPPRTVTEIFECAGTPILLLLTAENVNDSGDVGGADTSGTAAIAAEFYTGLTVDECKDAAISAALRLIERVLDGHHIELQESRLGGSISGIGTTSSFDTDVDTASITGGRQSTQSSKLVPTHVLDSILEAATLYRIVLNNQSGGRSNTVDGRLTQFVSHSFNSFLQHLRGELLEQSALLLAGSRRSNHFSAAQLSIGSGVLGGSTNELKDVDGDTTNRDDDNDVDDHDDDEAEKEEDEAYEQIAAAMNLLLQSVRQLASGLALPEVGIPVDLASLLVDQTVSLTETMVRRRVDQKFHALRFRVVKDCLEPFCRKSIEQHQDKDSSVNQNDPSRILHLVQMASVALSDALQLVDDTVRTVLSSSVDSSPASSTDAPMLKMAVETSTKRFAAWLANAMEVLAGCESSGRRLTIDAKSGDPDQDGGGEANSKDGDADGGGGAVVDTVPLSAKVSSELVDDMSEASDDDVGHEQVGTALFELVNELEKAEWKDARSDMTLAIAEMCRVAERSVMENINQSIATHGGGGKQRKSKVLFPNTTGEGSTAPNKKDPETVNNPTAERFRLAASRVLGLYAMDRGSQACWMLCSDLPQISSQEESDSLLEGPRTAVQQVLELFKFTSYDCAALFGGPKRAGPVPRNLEDELMSGYYSNQSSSKHNTAGARSGLLLDVERMFAEKVVVFPHPSEHSDFTRNSVLAIVIKVAFKGMVEAARCCRFSASGYRQWMVDVEFFKFMIPHFITNDFLPEGSPARAVVLRLLSDAIAAAEERCIDESIASDESSTFHYTNQARSVIREFMETHSGSDGIVSHFTIPED